MSRGKIPLTGPALLIYKLRAGGLNWLAHRLVEEWRLPRTAPGRALHRGVRSLRQAVLGSRAAPCQGNAEILYAFYDLAVAPVTFDFLWFLVGAELARQQRGSAAIHVVIVPGPHGGLRREDAEYEAHVGAAARRARIGSILVPACALLPSVVGLTVAATRRQAEQLTTLAGPEIFPERYEPALPIYPGPQAPLAAARATRAKVGLLRAAPADLAAVEQWLAQHGCDRPVVTITLRDWTYKPARNSDLAAWMEFARRLDPARFSVVFVPDAAQSLGRVPPELAAFPVFAEAALILGLRMALYERALVNLGVNNGPMGLCWLNERTNYITFKILNETAPSTTPEYMKLLGFEIGSSLPFATPTQRWVWADDTLAEIEAAFGEMLPRL